MTYYVALAISTKVELFPNGRMLPRSMTLDLKWSKGMVGACPVFKSLQDLADYLDMPVDKLEREKDYIITETS